MDQHLSLLARTALGVLATCSTVATAVGVTGLVSTPDADAVTAGTPTSAVHGSREAPRGAAPRIPYAVDTRPRFGDGRLEVVLPDGGRLAAPRGPMGSWAVVRGDGRGGGGPVVVREYQTEAGGVLQVVDADGSVTHEESGLPWVGLAATADGAVVGWQAANGRIRVREADGEPLTLRRTPGPSGLGALLGARTCREAEPEGGGCTAVVAARRGPARITTSHGIVDRLRGVRTGVDADRRGRLLAVLTTPGCYGVLSPGGTALRWRSCGAELPMAIGARGRVVAVADPHEDGHREVVVRDARGRTIHRWRSGVGTPASPGLGRGAVLTEVVWEDATHLLAVVRRGGRWDLLRLGLDGAVERAAATRRTGEFTPYRLPIT